MVKTAYIIIGVAIVLALAIGAVVYYQGGAPASNGTPVPTPVPASNGSDTTSTITAFQALTLGENDAAVKNWKAGNKNSAIAEISSDFCTNGMSDTWTLTYASDTEEAYVQIANSMIKGFSTVKTQERKYPFQQLLTNSLKDSNSSSNIASQSIISSGDYINGLASVTLSQRASGNPIWDMNYPVETGYYIVRIDASSGKVIESAHFQG